MGAGESCVVTAFTSVLGKHVELSSNPAPSFSATNVSILGLLFRALLMSKKASVENKDMIESIRYYSEMKKKVLC